eukprot:scaffold4691_cov62-Phaeocystis_antarctica.AAC.6
MFSAAWRSGARCAWRSAESAARVRGGVRCACGQMKGGRAEEMRGPRAGDRAVRRCVGRHET